ncbi:hypothetical protein [Hymenobacter guriensis]|uniref:Uncharacterized protein n=1 Tax=Hymenobacter guriensis TaxID=2793065 RepID=A0ABS0L7L3_9BACT|nr:hypothetical protein [Hymenobacter guriensis]MBG8556092.1 hypothetical protein [Hymenobacter guriensis]
MLTPNAFNCLLRHLDEIDRVVAAHLLRKRPWSETHLTSLLCDLLDEDTQSDTQLTYPLADLRRDLAQEDGLLGVQLSVETVEHNGTYERYISQSDIGLRLVFDNLLEPTTSWIRPYLLQAKRLFPQQEVPLRYTELSRFKSADKEQDARILLLTELFGKPYLKYLLYCPRPEKMEADVSSKLAYLRNKQLNRHIFDYTAGMALHQALSNGSVTLKAGLFVADPEHNPVNLGAIHAGILHATLPFSWFIALNFLDDDWSSQQFVPTAVLRPDPASAEFQLVDGIVTGKQEIIEQLLEKARASNLDGVPANIQIIPRHTITVRVSVGEQLDPDNRYLKLQ